MRALALALALVPPWALAQSPAPRPANEDAVLSPELSQSRPTDLVCDYVCDPNGGNPLVVPVSGRRCPAGYACAYSCIPSVESLADGALALKIITGTCHPPEKPIPPPEVIDPAPLLAPLPKR